MNEDYTQPFYLGAGKAKRIPWLNGRVYLPPLEPPEEARLQPFDIFSNSSSLNNNYLLGGGRGNNDTLYAQLLDRIKKLEALTNYHHIKLTELRSEHKTRRRRPY